MELILKFAALAGSIMTILGCIIFFVKPIRKWVVDKINKANEETEEKQLIKEMHSTLNEIKQNSELQNEASLSLLRSDITRIYFKYFDTLEIPYYERENLIKQKNIYSLLHGNTYIDTIYSEMLEWKVKK